ncbi:hypothetical protein JD551_00630 [Aeromonas caviae]|uniref:hypothetical protein n=1 Tax=Aeromonas caviae TaxID=648 RepID=UPI00191D2AA4|nr:hypothetical protein [Aeromonas caviae]MBL0547602.1 hypothetical protein [Aeromonas caviae]
MKIFIPEQLSIYTGNVLEHDHHENVSRSFQSIFEKYPKLKNIILLDDGDTLNDAFLLFVNESIYTKLSDIPQDNVFDINLVTVASGG